MTWRGEPEPPAGPGHLAPADWLRILRRALPLGLVLLVCLVLMLLCRLPERLLVGQRRPVTSVFPRIVARFGLWVLGFRATITGTPMTEAGAVVANHASWLDIFALNAFQRVTFVAKSEVRSWPGIGLLAAAAGTVFIRRDRSEALAQRETFRRQLELGARLLFFPEGTSTDGLRVLPFKSTLFDAFIGPGMEAMLVQPVSVAWISPEGQPPGWYGWWGDMDFGANMLKVLAARRQGRLELVYHPPLRAAEVGDRKKLAKLLGDRVRLGQSLALGRDS